MARHHSYSFYFEENCLYSIICLLREEKFKFRQYEDYKRSETNLQITCFKRYLISSYSKSLKFFRTSENGLNSAYFAKIAHKIAKPKYFPNIFDDSDSPINSLSDDIQFVGVTEVFRKLLVGGPPRTAASFYSANMCISLSSLSRQFDLKTSA